MFSFDHWYEHEHGFSTGSTVVFEINQTLLSKTIFSVHFRITGWFEDRLVYFRVAVYFNDRSFYVWFVKTNTKVLLKEYPGRYESYHISHAADLSLVKPSFRLKPIDRVRFK